MRTLLRAGVVTLAASSTLLVGAVAAQAAPAGAVTINVNRLILEPGQYGHTGSLRIAIRNTTTETLETITITEPIPATIGNIDGGLGCGLGSTPDNRGISSCLLENPIEPGHSGVITASFRSPAKPQPFAQVPPARGSVEVGGVTADFDTLFRATTGSLRNPRPYVQDTTGSLTVTAGDVTLTRQEDGTFAGRVPVTVHNNGDAPHYELWTDLATPAGIDEWPDIDPADACVGSDGLPVPPGGSAIGCSVVGGQLAEGQDRTFDWVLHAPADTAVGPLGTATTMVRITGSAVAQTDGANMATFGITVAE